MEISNENARYYLNQRKLCFVTHDFKFFRVFIFNLLASLAKSFDITVITDRSKVKKQDMDLALRNNISVKHLEKRTSQGIIRYLYSLRKSLTEVSPEHVFFTTVEISIFGALASKFRSKYKTHFIITGTGPELLSRKIWHRFLRKIYLIIFKISSFKTNTDFIFQNTDDKAFFLRSGFSNSNNSYVIGHFGIKATCNIKNFFSTPVNFFVAARLVRSKGFIELFNATEDLAKLGLNFHVFIAGDESFESTDALSLYERSLLNNSSYITYLGHIDYEEMSYYYQKFDVYILPSHREGLSTAALEAAANGMPLIVTDAPGCIECHNNNGFVVKAKDSEDLARAMRCFIDNPALVKKFSQHSINHIKHNYSTEIMHKAYVKIIG